MNSATTFETASNSLKDTFEIARTLGRKLQGGEVIELVSDLGGGKTAFVRGLAEGVASHDSVQSPSFTLSRVYRGHDGIEIHHFDFHRLNDAGILSQQLAELIANQKAVVVIEWADIVKDVLPKEHLRIEIDVTGEDSRLFKFFASGQKHARLIEAN